MSLYKRAGSPYWQTEFTLRGHRIRESTGTSSKREAEQYERKRKAEVRQELASPAVVGKLSLDQACGKYWLEHGCRRRDATDVQRWLTYVLTYMDRDMLLSDLSARTVNDFVAAMRAAGIGEISINRTVTTLQGVHNRAAKLWEEPVSVIGWKPFKTKEHGRSRWLTQDQAKALLAALPPHIRALVWFMLLTGIRKNVIEGDPDEAHISTSYIERSNLTMRMHNRRFTRLTNAFSKKFENHAHMVAIYAVWYNFLRVHKTLRVTPAMEAGICDTLLKWEDLLTIFDAEAPKPGRPKTYKKRKSDT